MIKRRKIIVFFESSAACYSFSPPSFDRSFGFASFLRRFFSDGGKADCGSANFSNSNQNVVPLSLPSALSSVALSTPYAAPCFSKMLLTIGKPKPVPTLVRFV